MKVLKKVEKIPGGLLIIPMLIAAIIGTFFSSIFQIGGPTTALFSGEGTLVLIGLILFISGSQLKLSDVPATFKKGGVLIIARIFLAWLFSSVFIKLFGMEGMLGISAIAFVAVITSANPGLYLALMNTYGDDCDQATFGILNLLAVPIVPILILNLSSGTQIDYLGIIATLFPFVLGMFLGNLDINIQKMLKPGIRILLPFLGMNFGAAINLIIAFQSSGTGIILTVLFLVFCMIPLIYLDRLILKESGIAAAAMCSVAGISLVVPALITEINLEYAAYANQAVAQIAFTVILTSIISPFVTKKISNNSRNIS